MHGNRKRRRLPFRGPKPFPAKAHRHISEVVVAVILLYFGWVVKVILAFFDHFQTAIVYACEGFNTLQLTG